MNSILLVEDDETLGATLRERLEKEGYSTVLAGTRAQALEEFKKGSFALCILDVGLPDGSGLDLARDIRMHTEMPVIFLTAMNSAEYRLEGFELGAVDYIPKPFFLREVLLRVERVLRRSRQQTPRRFGNMEIDFNKMSVKLPNGEVEFPGTRDFSVLKLLVDSAPAAVSREDIIARLWQSDKLSSARSVDNAVLRLRRLLRRGGADQIRSVRGIGYQWVEE